MRYILSFVYDFLRNENRMQIDSYRFKKKKQKKTPQNPQNNSKQASISQS